MSIWCIWHEIHAIKRYIHQEFIKKSLDHKDITPSCLLISTNYSSLRGFVMISASWSFMLTNSSVMSPFYAWSLRKWCFIFICLVLECCTGFFEMFMALVLSHFIGTCSKIKLKSLSIIPVTVRSSYQNRPSGPGRFAAGIIVGSTTRAEEPRSFGG